MASCVECPICLDTVREAAVCPCPGRHSFCKECLVGVKALACPVCRDASGQVAVFFLDKAAPPDGGEWRRAQVCGLAAGGHVQLMRALHAEGWDVDFAGPVCPLLAAAEAGQAEAVLALLDLGADKDRLSGGQTALHLAAQQSHTAVVAELLARGARQVTNEDGLSPLHVAAAYGSLEVVTQLVDAGAGLDDYSAKGYTPLRMAAEHGQLPVVVRLLSYGADRDKPSRNGHSPLHVAAALGHSLVVLGLLHYGAAVDLPSAAHGYTPLMLAVWQGHLDVVRLLAEAGADRAKVSVDRETACDIAERLGAAGIARYLSLRPPKRRKLVY